MRVSIHSPSRIQGTVTLPGDKSISQRAALFNSIAGGAAHISNFCQGDDGRSIIRCLKGLGVVIRKQSPCGLGHPGECLEVRGRGPHGLREPSTVLNAGNSGTTMRLVAGLLAAQPFFAVLSGDASLRSRPMARVVGPLRQMGAEIMGRGDGDLAPLAVRGGPLEGIHHSMPVASAQLKSSLLVAGLHADGPTTLDQPADSRDHSERMLLRMGGDLQVDGLRLVVRRSELSPVDVDVPGDISSAAFWMVAGACHPNARILLRDVGVNPTRTGVIDVLRSMGARIRLENVREAQAEPVADIVVESSSLTATEIGDHLVPRVIDELPVLALAACFARGRTVIANAAELRVKETDRISATARGLSALGARITERPDGLEIEGPTRLEGAACRSFGDHRIAMAMGVAGLLAKGETVVEGAETAAVSYPWFWDTLRSLSTSEQGVP